MSLCLIAGTVSAVLAINGFTLAWTHSIEKIRWEEDWRIDGHTLVIDEARIRGSGAGMEPPPDAMLKDGVWRYRPPLPPQPQLRLSHSPYTADYELCAAGSCRSLGALLPALPPSAWVELRPCSRQGDAP